MATGKVKWYNEMKGFGFIKTDDGEDVFVHRTGLDSTTTRLEPEQAVEFETKAGEKGMMAVNVKAVR